jgi:hypothetical protein
MFLRLWAFRPASGREADFLRAYGPDGDWARLFRRARGFAGTELLSPTDGGAWITIDRWERAEDWDTFRRELEAEYEALDHALEGLCAEERSIGDFVARG